MNGQHALEVYADDTLIFHSDGKWLYPLFELERFLATAGRDPATLTARDKIVGRAAALLMVRLGIGRVFAGLLSEPGKEALEHFGVPYACERLVERISCRTEEILRDEYDLERAYRILRERANLSNAKQG